MSLESNRILNWIVFLPIIGVIVTTTILAVIYIRYENNIYNKNIEDAKIKYLKESKIKSQERIENISSLLRINERLLKEEAKEEIQNIVNLAIELISTTYNNNIYKSEEEIIKEINKKLRDVRFFKNLSGYFFIYKMNGDTVLLPPKVEWEGRNLLELQDLNGQFMIKEIIKIGKEKGSGFHEWYWFKPHDMQQRMKKKIGFVKLYAPLNIIIGSAKYEEDMLHAIKKEAKNFLENVSYTDGGRIFAYDSKGKFITKNLNKPFLRKTPSQVDQIIKGIKIQPEGFFISHITSKSFEDDENLKYNSSFVKYIPEIDWIVGINTYGERMLEELNVKEKEIKQKLQDSLVNMFIIITCVIMIILLVMLSISKRLSRILNYYQNKILIKHNKTMRQKKLLQHQVQHDALTKLPNRVLLTERLEQLIKRAKRENYNLAIVFIDVDKFKSINDTFGHHIGDILLQKVAKRLKFSIRETDLVARLSGDEFIVVFDKCKGTYDVINAISKLQNNFSKPIRLEDTKHKITLSIGICVYPEDGDNVQDLLKNADTAMLNTKEEGRNAYKFFTKEMNDSVQKQIRIEAELRQALQNQEFILHYQPIVNARTGVIEGTEALIRWNHPTRGLVYPDYFIEIAEESNLIVEIGEWVTREAMAQVVTWRYKGLNPGRVSINFAGKQLEKDGVYEFITKTLEETYCKSEWISIEVIERYIMKNPEKCIKLLKKLRDINIGISIDDFGTGYSSLSYLKQLPITKLKVDRTFVKNVIDSFEDRAIAKTIIALAEGLYLKVLAEGVETKAQRDFFVKNGCTQIQGYFFSKPLPPEEMELLLEKEE